MINHTQLNQINFGIAVKNTKIFQSFPKFKQDITQKRKNTDRLHDYYQQACRNGIDYIRQNPNIFGNDIEIIKEIIST